MTRTPSKFAYECPKGHGKVWGKPGLELNCGICGKRYRSEALPGGDHTNQAARFVVNDTQGAEARRSTVSSTDAEKAVVGRELLDVGVRSKQAPGSSQSRRRGCSRA